MVLTLQWSSGRSLSIDRAARPHGRDEFEYGNMALTWREFHELWQRERQSRPTLTKRVQHRGKELPNLRRTATPNDSASKKCRVEWLRDLLVRPIMDR